jgi:peptide-methionine (R)-S-oxide reductase
MAVPVCIDMHRREFLKFNAAGAACLLAGGALGRRAWGAAAPSTSRDDASHSADTPVTIVKFADNGARIGRLTAVKVRDDERWRRTLSSLAYQVTREAGTEPPFTIPGYDRHDAGLYRCVCCDNALYSSSTKYDSGTGWPSFWQPIAAENIRANSDTTLFMRRTEVLCTLCDAHLGHVFNDGPRPTGLRYCMNLVAMRFVPQPAKS